MGTIAKRRIVAYPPRDLSVAKLGYNVGGVASDNAHIDLAVAGGASLFRVQLGWETVEDYATGNLSLGTTAQTFLAYCATKGVKPVIVAAFGSPRTTLGTLTVSGTVANGSAAGTSIPVNSYGFTIDPSTNQCFAGSAGYPTNRSSYYGALITSAGANSITLASALNRQLNPGDTLAIQRLRYSPPATDTDPSIAAFVRYATYLAQQIGAAGAQGYVDIWNEYQWPNDTWPELSTFYDSPPGGITVTPAMTAALTQLQAASLPAGVKLVNGVSDKSAGGSVTGQGIAGTNFTHDSMHPYGNTPEYQAWTYYAWGFNGNRALPAVYGVDNNWEVLIPADIGSNFRGMGFNADIKPTIGQWPGIMVTEGGYNIADDLVQARWCARHVLCHWGLGQPVIIYQFDGGAGDLYSVAPSSTPRQAYTVLQRIMAILGRMGATPSTAGLPCVLGWASDNWPLMATTVQGATAGNSVLFAWQRTWVNTADPWPGLPSPSAQPVSIYVPTGLSVKEAIDVITGNALTVTNVAANVISVPVTDNPIAVRVGP